MLFTLFSSYVQSGGTPLWAASFDAHQQCMELLINAGGIINVPTEVSVSRSLWSDIKVCLGDIGITQDMV